MQLDQMISAPPGAYKENAWQKEFLRSSGLLYPKYIAAFSSVPVKDFEVPTTPQLDFMLVSGYVDVLEIKQPFDDCIVTPGVPEQPCAVSRTRRHRAASRKVPLSPDSLEVEKGRQLWQALRSPAASRPGPLSTPRGAVGRVWIHCNYEQPPRAA